MRLEKLQKKLKRKISPTPIPRRMTAAALILNTEALYTMCGSSMTSSGVQKPMSGP